MKENNQNFLVIILIVFSDNLITIIIFGVTKKFIIKITPDYSSLKKYSNSSNPI